MSKQEFLAEYARYLMVSKQYTPTRAHECCSVLEEFLDTWDVWVICKHDGSNDEHS